jgi:hypothetical protein
MMTRVVITSLLCIWVFAISAPSILYLTTEDAALIISLSANEEEPGEGEKKDGLEETLTMPETWQLFLGFSFSQKDLLQLDSGAEQESIQEIILPPPESYTFYRQV